MTQSSPWAGWERSLETHIRHTIEIVLLLLFWIVVVLAGYICGVQCDRALSPGQTYLFFFPPAAVSSVHPEWRFSCVPVLRSWSRPAALRRSTARHLRSAWAGVSVCTPEYRQNPPERGRLTPEHGGFRLQNKRTCSIEFWKDKFSIPVVLAY